MRRLFKGIMAEENTHTPITIETNINGQLLRVTVPEDLTLLSFLRDELRLTGAKNGCNTGHCGACTVIMNGKCTRACLVKMSKVNGATIETIEGLTRNGQLHPIQQAF